MDKLIKSRVWVFSKNKMYSVSGFCFDDAVGDVEVFDDVAGGYRCWNSQKGECAVMYFTGLPDKNGKEICEGDIDKRKGVVIWNPKYAGFCLKDTVGTEKCDDISLEDSGSWIEIVGNIYENPELLKT